MVGFVRWGQKVIGRTALKSGESYFHGLIEQPQKSTKSIREGIYRWFDGAGRKSTGS